jgi:hypothetical protein
VSILCLAVSAPNFAKKLLEFTQGPFIAVGTYVTFGSGLYALWEWYWGGRSWNLETVGRFRVRNWEALARSVNKGVAMGFLAGIPWFGVALWAGIKGFG